MAEWLATWGYWGLFVCIFVGNLGIPMPEETVLLAAGLVTLLGVSVRFRVGKKRKA